MGQRNTSQKFPPLDCQLVNEILKNVTPVDYEPRNMTLEAFIVSIGSLDCIPKRYLGLQGINKWIVAVILIILLVFGLIGNILSATIMYRRARRGLSSYFYLALLAFVDICVLYSSCLFLFFDIAFNYQPLLRSSIHCRVGYYIQHISTYISAWLIVAVTFERFIVVRFPFQSILICRMRVAHGITLTIILFFALYTSHGFFAVDVFHVPIQTNSGYDPNFTICDLKIYREIFVTLDLCFYSVLPSIFIIVFNILIISTMFYAIKQRRNYLQASSYRRTTNESSRNFNTKNKSPSSTRALFFRSRSIELTPVGRSYTPHGRTYQNGMNKSISLQQKSNQILFDSTSATGIRLTCLLLIISFIFVLCTSPMPIRFLTAHLVGEYHTTLRWQFNRITLSLLMYLNHTVNFVFYCLTGRAFRNECRKILCGVWALKDVHISCTINPDSNKTRHCHQQIFLTDRNQMINPAQQQQQQQQPRMKRLYT